MYLDPYRDRRVRYPLTPEQVAEIERRVKTERVKVVALDFNVSVNVIYKIRARMWARKRNRHD